MAQDPFAMAGVATYDIIEFKPTMATAFVHLKAAG